MRFMREVRAECHRLDIEGLERAGQRRPRMRFGVGARLRARGASDSRTLDRDLIGALRRLRDARRDRALGLGGDARRAAAARDRGRASAFRSQRDRRRTARASDRGAAASGCRSALSARASTSSSRQRACAPSASIRPDERRPARPARAGCRRRRARSPFRSTGARSRSSGTTAVTRPIRSTATTTLRRMNGLRPCANGGGPYDRGACAARARGSTRAISSRRVVERLDALPRPSAAGPDCSSARSTPSCSVTGGTRDRHGWRRWSRRRGRSGPRARDASRSARAPRAP